MYLLRNRPPAGLIDRSNCRAASALNSADLFWCARNFVAGFSGSPPALLRKTLVARR